MPTQSFGAKFKLFLKSNHQLLTLFFCLTLLNVFFLCQCCSSNGISFSKTFIILLIGSIILELALCAILFVSKNRQWPIEKLFLILGLIIGTFYVFALPVGRAPDEESHFFRVYEISTGHLVSDTSEDKIGSMQAENIEIIRDFKTNNVTYSQVIDNLGLYPDQSNQTFVITSAYSYNFLSYLPQTIGMTIGNVLHLPLLISAYIAKLFNLIACIIILYYSIKFTPFFKHLVFFLAFLPITMQAMASFSPDGLLIATAVALISFVLYSIHNLNTKFQKKHYCLMFIICLILSISKFAYAPLCLLLFAIPKERFGSTKRKYSIIISMGAVIFALLLAWFIIMPTMQSVSDTTTQISTILSNPFKYLAIVVQSISTNAGMYIFGFFGGYLEWFNVTLSPIYIYATLIIFALLCAKSKEEGSIPKLFKILSIIIFVIISLITFTTMFIQWTKVGETVIDGVQGRYFLPLLLLIPSFFLPTSQKTNSTNNAIKKSQNPIMQTAQYHYLYGFLAFESVYALIAIVCTHL